jgi:hypothetical protein
MLLVLLGSQWKKPSTCACCDHSQHTAKMFTNEVADNLASELHLEMFHVTDPFIHPHRINAVDTKPFVFKHSLLNGLMLSVAGVVEALNMSSLTLCADGQSDLLKGKLPHYASKNRLYQGILPEDFHDLTWVEEMICAKYRNTPHVTRLYGSTDPKQPLVFHSNTCAHDMNVVSTASKFPRTPGDINSTLSVVFVGPGKFHIECLKDTFRIHKIKVWNFLKWVKFHNDLYFELDPQTVEQYPDVDLLPGLKECVIEDHETDVTSIFNEETAGFSDHPAADAASPSTGSSAPFVLLEKMGVSDPEGDCLSGRAFTASALCNILPEDANRPDLILHHGSQPIHEYNLDLMPGMYPMFFFPFGIGGFDDPQHPTHISFEKQANYYFNITYHSFHYHQSFFFVALNI